MKGLKCSVSRLKYIVMSGSMTECLFRRGVCLWEVKMQCFYCLHGSMTECLLRRGVCLWEVKNAVFTTIVWEHIYD